MSKILLFQPKNRHVHLLVGGKVCEYETSEEAIKREVLEELGITKEKSGEYVMSGKQEIQEQSQDEGLLR